ncbi:uncharacterized protein LOC124527870 isoform X3 [Lynx rufus]|uniref:uncharacterized protein LOC124527870 isoform X3 n=1 Tax=Lynx rufus TaxID=61384 RepID=UPI001F124E48|nr:uncharacterized protein LOC124527870 isoform X3 [Lynx rufus]
MVASSGPCSSSLLPSSAPPRPLWFPAGQGPLTTSARPGDTRAPTLGRWPMEERNGRRDQDTHRPGEAQVWLSQRRPSGDHSPAAPDAHLRQARVGVEPTADELRGRILPTERSAPAGSQPKPGPQGDGEGAAKWGPQWCLPCLTEPRKAERQDEGSQGPQACATPRTQLTLGSTCYIG